jgi:hypothetical protein
LPLRAPGVIEAAPLIWTAPARSAGVARLACQRELRFSSLTSPSLSMRLQSLAVEYGLRLLPGRYGG